MGQYLHINELLETCFLQEVPYGKSIVSAIITAQQCPGTLSPVSSVPFQHSSLCQLILGCYFVIRFVASLENDLTARAKTSEVTVADFSSGSYATIFGNEVRFQCTHFICSCV